MTENISVNEIQRQQKENQAASPGKAREAKLAAQDSTPIPLDQRPRNQERDNPEATFSPKRAENPKTHTTFSVPDTEKEAEERKDLLEDRGQEASKKQQDQTMMKPRRKTAHERRQLSSDQEEEETLSPTKKQRKMTMITNNKGEQITLHIPERKPEVQIIQLDKNSPLKIKVQKLGQKTEQKQKREGLIQEKREGQEFPEKDMNGNILMPSQKMIEKQRQLTRTILDVKKDQSRTYFLFEAIPLGTRMEFEVMIDQSSFFKRKYSFWMGGDQGKMLLMEGKKNLKVLQDYYIIREYMQGMNALNFLAKMQTNASRKQFILSNEPEYQQHKDRNIYADLTLYSSINGKPSIAAYFPTFDDMTRQQREVKMYDDKEILKTLVKGAEETMNYLVLGQLEKVFERSFLQQNNIKGSDKNVAFVNKEGNLAVYIAKVQKKKYKIWAGAGVSPLILFALFISVYES